MPTLCETVRNKLARECLRQKPLFPRKCDIQLSVRYRLVTHDQSYMNRCGSVDGLVNRMLRNFPVVWCGSYEQP